jgi:hypothetical protein
LSLILLSLVLTGARQGVSRGVIFPLDVDDAEIVILEFLMPPRGPTSQLLWGLPVCEVFVVRFYHEGFLGPNEVGSPVIYHLDYSKKLKIVSVVVLFSRGECGRVVSHQVVSSWGSRLCSFVLREDHPNSILRRIGLEVEHFAEVGLLQDWFANHPVSEFFEGPLLVVFPVPWCGLFREVQEGSRYLRVVLDKVSVVAREP